MGRLFLEIASLAVSDNELTAWLGRVLPYRVTNFGGLDGKPLESIAHLRRVVDADDELPLPCSG